MRQVVISLANVKKQSLPFALLVALAGIAYSGMFHGEPVLDDLPRIDAGAPTWVEVVSSQRPLSQGLWKIGGADRNLEFAHTIGFGLHLVNVVLVYTLLALLTSPMDVKKQSLPSIAALAGAAAFAVHPMMTQAVVYVTGNASALCAMFYFIALLAVVLWIQQKDWRWLVVVSAAGLMAILTKPEAYALPLTVAGFWVVLTGRRQLAVAILSVFAVLAMVYLLRHPALFMADSPARFYGERLSVTVGLGRNIATMPLYFLGRYLVPIRQSIDPDFPALRSIDIIVSIGIWVVLLVLPWIPSLPVLPRLGFAVLAYSPFLIEIPGLAQATFIEEHHAYIPGIGVAFLIAWGFSRYPVFFAAVITLFLLLTIDRVSLWQTRIAIWQDAARIAQSNPRPHAEYAEELIRHGYPLSARHELQRALEIDPKDYPAQNNLAALEYQMGHRREAENLWIDLRARAPQFHPAEANLDLMR